MGVRYDGKSDDFEWEDNAWMEEEIGGYDALEGVTADEIADDKRIAPWKAGRYVLQIDEIEKPEEVTQHVFYNDVYETYPAKRVEIRFVDKNDPKKKIKFQVILPPVGSTPEETAAFSAYYRDGFTARKNRQTQQYEKGKAQGWHANVFKHLFARLGFEGPGGVLTKEAFRPREWFAFHDGTRREVIGTVKLRASDSDPNTKYPELDWFGFDMTDLTRSKLAEAPAPARAARPATAARPAAPATTARAAAPATTARQAATARPAKAAPAPAAADEDFDV